MTDRSNWPVKKYRLGEEPPDDGILHIPREQRPAVAWELSVFAWRLRGIDLDGQRLRRDVVRVVDGEH